MTRGVTIVGASLAGIRTAKFLRRYGFEDPITLIGEEPHRPYDRPPLSKQVLAGTMDPAATALEGDDVYADLDLRLGVPAVALDVAAGAVRLQDGEVVTGAHVVVATGAAPRRLPAQPDLAGIHLLRSLDDARALRQDIQAGTRVVIVGAGFIGMEVAATARGLGADVTVVELFDVPLLRGLGPDLGARVGRVHEEAGVELLLSASVAAFEGNGRVQAVVLADGTRMPADVVVIGIGVVPATGWLQGSGLELDDGVVCDDHLRARGGDGRVWAVGDVARWPSGRYGESLRIEHWTNATETAQVVARNITGTDAVHDPVPYVWSDQYDLKIQVLGRVTADDDLDVVLGDLDTLRLVAVATRQGRVRGAVGVGMPRALMRFRQLIEDADDLEAARALAAGFSV